MIGNVPLNPLLTAATLALACAVLSVIVVLRRWAFIGEGISHSGFGGAGTAWLMMAFFPALDLPWLPYLCVVLFCVGTALAIGAVSRGRTVHADAAIGIFLVASLAWGFLAQQIYLVKRHGMPTLWDNLLFGQSVPLSVEYTRAAVVLCLAIILIVLAFWKEIISYSFDPLLAQTSGVRSGFIHYLLMLLLAVVIVIGTRVAGSVLVTALLVLPGAAALRVSQKLTSVLTFSMIIALIGAVAGLVIHTQWRFIPAGPAIVLTLFAEFILTYGFTCLRPLAPGKV